MASQASSHDLPPEVIGNVASSFRLGSLDLQGQPREGTRYLAYRLSTPRGDFALLRPRQESPDKIKEKGISERLLKAHRIIQHLGRSSFPVAVPILTRSRASLVTICGIPYALYPYVDGEPMDQGNTRQTMVAGATLASYHRLMAGYQGPACRSEGFFPQQFERRLQTFREHVESIEGLSSSVGIEASLDYLRKRLPDVEVRLSSVPYDFLPKVVIHGDFKYKNLLFNGDELSAVIDFGRSQFDARSLDLAIALCDWVPKDHDESSLSLARCFVLAYDTVLPLEKVERDALPVLTEARIAWRAFRRIRKLVRKQGTEKRLKRAEKFSKYVDHLEWLERNSSKWEKVFAERREIA